MSAHLFSRVLLPAFLLYVLTTQVWASGCMSPPEALQHFLHQGGWGTPDTYVVALHDLNSDGAPEAVVLLTGPDWCGSGGCTMLVVEQHGPTWHLISKTTLVHPPVLALERKRSGWQSLGVTLGGGGLAYHPVVLDFRHGHYPASPIMAPPLPAASSLSGETLIDGWKCQRHGARPNNSSKADASGAA